MSGEGGVAEGRVVGVPKFHSWDKCTMALTNMNSNWMSNASSGLCINLCYLYYLGPLSCILRCNKNHCQKIFANFLCQLGQHEIPKTVHFKNWLLRIIELSGTHIKFQTVNNLTTLQKKKESNCIRQPESM